MTIPADEFIRRFLPHVRPDGFCRIRHYGLFGNGDRADKLALSRRLLGAPRSSGEKGETMEDADQAAKPSDVPACPCCGDRMKLVENFEGWFSRARLKWRADTS